MFNLRKILRNFKIFRGSSEFSSSLLSESKGYEFRHTAKIYLIRLNRLNLVLKRVPAFGLNEKQIENSLNLQVYLLENNIPVPKIYETENGSLFFINIEEEKEFYILQSYMPGDNIPISHHSLSSIAEALAALHDASSNFYTPPNLSLNICPSTKYNSSLNKLIKGALLEISKKRKLAREDIILLEGFFSKCITSIKKHCPIMKTHGDRFQYIHGDFNNRNVILAQNKVSAIIDFDNARLGDPLDDIIRFLLHITVFKFDGVVRNFNLTDNTYIQHFFKAYSQNRHIGANLNPKVWPVVYMICIELATLMVLRGFIIEYEHCDALFHQFREISDIFSKEGSTILW